MLLVALDPFYFEFARILGVDGLMSSALFASFAAYWAYWRTQRRAYVLAAGALLGLAILTKVSALALGPFILAAELVWLYTNRKKGIQLRHKAVDAALLSGIVALTCFALWPVLWVAPLESAGRVLDYSFSTSSGDASLNSPQFFNGRLYPSGEFDNALFYPITLLWRSSPIILIGLALTLTFLVNRRGDISGAIPGALGFALLFIVLMTVSTKRFDRYILPVYLFLDLAAAWGLVEWGKRFSRRARLGGLAALSLAGAAMLVQTHPYYLSYYNPVMRLTNAPQNVLGIGWGEGMNEAAQFLNEQPDIYNQTIFAWYPEALKFHLNSHPAQPQQIQYAQEVGDVDYNDALSADWVVIYINLAQRELAKPITDHYAAQTPAKVITINGIDYVKIYRNP
jgi:4-amino-4-deoxy-L-arabinose transferase-like glycosyltransferase